MEVDRDANIVADAISRLPKEEHETPLPKEQIELNLSELLEVSDLYVTETVDQFAINAEEIDFPLAPQLVEVEQKLELHTAAGITTKAALLDTKSQWDYREVEGINLSTLPRRSLYPRPCANVHWNGTIITYVTQVGTDSLPL